MKTKADFKAMREGLGMSQALLADLMGVHVKSVKRWEQPNETAYHNAPQDAWDILREYQARQREIVDFAIAKAVELDATMPDGAVPTVSLTYWFSEDEYEQAHPGEGRFWQMANANSRLTAYLLRGRGYEVDFNYPGLAATVGER